MSCRGGSHRPVKFARGNRQIGEMRLEVSLAGRYLNNLCGSLRGISATAGGDASLASVTTWPSAFAIPMPWSDDGFTGCHATRQHPYFVLL